jgi:hypothetical protein
MLSTFDVRFCRVCGFEPADPPWGADGRSPSFDFCACCGVEWGYGDATSGAVAQSRRTWIDSGARWAEPDQDDGLSLGDRLQRALPLSSPPRPH